MSDRKKGQAAEAASTPATRKKIRVELPKNVWIWCPRYLQSVQDVIRNVADPLFDPAAKTDKRQLLCTDYPRQCPDALNAATFVISGNKLCLDLLHQDVYFPWADVNGEVSNEISFDETRRLHFDRKIGKFSVATAGVQKGNSWVLKTCYHERESDTKVMMRHIFLLYEAENADNVYTIVSYKVSTQEGRDKSPVPEPALDAFKKRLSAAGRRRPPAAFMDEDVKPARGAPAAQRGSSGQTGARPRGRPPGQRKQQLQQPRDDDDEDYTPFKATSTPSPVKRRPAPVLVFDDPAEEYEDDGTGKKIKLDLDAFSRNPLFKKQKAPLPRVKGLTGAQFESMLYNDYPNFDEAFVQQTVKAIQKARLPLKAGIKKLGIAAPIVENWVENGLDYSDLKFDMPDGVELWSTWLPSDMALAKIAVFGMSEYAGRICTQPPYKCVPQFTHCTYLIDMRESDVTDDDLRLDDYAPYEERSTNTVTAFKLNAAKNALVCARMAREKYIADYNVTKYFTVKKDPVYGSVKRCLAYVFPLNEPKPLLAMVNYIRENVPQEELEEAAVKPVRKGTEDEKEMVFSEFVDQATDLAEGSKDSNLTPVQAFERMKRLVKMYDDKSKTLVKPEDTQTSLQMTRKQRLRTKRELVDDIAEQTFIDVPDEEAQIPFAEYLGERDDGHFVTMLVHSRKPGYCYKFMAEGSRARPTSHWLCVQCKVQIKPAKNRAEMIALGIDPETAPDCFGRLVTSHDNGTGRVTKRKYVRRNVAIPYKRFTVRAGCLPPMSILAMIDKGHLCTGPTPTIKMLTNLACKDIRKKHVNGEASLWDAHKEVMRELYVDLMRRGYTREEAFAEMPYCCAIMTRKDEKKAVQKRYEIDSVVPVPAQHKQAPGRWYKLREWCQRETEEPFTLDDKDVDDQLLEDKDLRQRAEEGTRFANALKGLNLLPGRHGPKMYQALKNEARKLPVPVKDDENPDLYYIDEGDTRFTVAHEGPGDFKCNCHDFTEVYGHICKHTRQVVKHHFWSEAAEWNKQVTVRIREDNELTNNLIELGDKTYEPHRVGRRRWNTSHNFLGRFGRGLAEELDSRRRSLPAKPSTATAFHKALAQIPPHLNISSLEWNIIIEKADEFTAAGVVQRFPRDPDLFLVIVDRQPFTVQRHGLMQYECNCDQFAALYCVCMHCMAVARLLDESDSYISLVERFVVVDEEDTAGQTTLLEHHEHDQSGRSYGQEEQEVYDAVNALDDEEIDMEDDVDQPSTSTAVPKQQQQQEEEEATRKTRRATAGKSSRYAHEEW